MNTGNNISIEVLAEKLGGTVWSKGDLKRIYLNRGYNTKKMTTKTYVYQLDNGSFAVSCFINCPSQHPSWIDSQKQEVIEGVEAEIEEALATTYYVIIDDNTNEFIDADGKPQPLNYICESDRYLSADAAENFIRKELGKGYFVKAFDRTDFEAQVALLDAKDAEQRAENTTQPVVEPVQPTLQSIALDENNLVNCKSIEVGKKYKHGKFGVGLVTSIELDGKVIKMDFDGVEKTLMSAFVKLEAVND